MVQFHPGPPTPRLGVEYRIPNVEIQIVVSEFRASDFVLKHSGGVAQLGERLPCTQEVIGSNPFTSTIPMVCCLSLMMAVLFFDN